MKNKKEIYKHYLMLKITEKSHQKRLEILSKHHEISQGALAWILELQEERYVVQNKKQPRKEAHV